MASTADAQDRPPDLSFILVAYESGDLLLGAPQSIDRSRDLATAAGYAVEVIVVDNASNDGAIGRAQRAFPDVRVIGNTTNRGFAAASNQAFAHARGRYVCTLNPDAEVDERFVIEAVRCLDDHPRIALLAPVGRWTGSDGERYSSSAGDLPKIDPPTLLLRLRTQESPSPTGIDRVRYVWGTGLILRRDAAQRDRFFAERWFLFGEEFELCDRLRSAGWEIAAYDAVRIAHAVGASYTRQVEAIRAAGRLQHAVRWELHRSRWGGVWALANELVALADNAALYGALMLKGAHGDERGAADRAIGRRHMRARYGVGVRASVGVLTCRSRYLARADRLARQFFTSSPTRPTATPENS